jgi:hypothetical protein
MKMVLVISLALFGWLSGLVTARAADSCSKECRDFQRACLKAHSQGACKTDYDICVRHCKK